MTTRVEELLVELIGEVRALRTVLEQDQPEIEKVDVIPLNVRPKLTAKGAADVERLLAEAG